ncbi:MAG: hypothetical protein ACYTEU_00870 [Planctomycetota bacterium]|jgi:hypothetical protein
MKEKKIILRTCLGFLFLLVVAVSVYVYYCYQVTFRGGELKGLATALMSYADDNNGCLPDATKWCDVLIEEDWLYPEYVVNGQVKHAMNINASGMKVHELPEDMVLLFEAKGPKNLSGGPELIKTQKYRWPGHAVQFGYTVDYIRFYKKDEIDNLRWKP